MIFDPFIATFKYFHAPHCLEGHLLHCSWVDDVRLEARQPRKLQDGDTISFGGAMGLLQDINGGLALNPLVFKVVGLATLFAPPPPLPDTEPAEPTIAEPAIAEPPVQVAAVPTLEGTSPVIVDLTEASSLNSCQIYWHTKLRTLQCLAAAR